MQKKTQRRSNRAGRLAAVVAVTGAAVAGPQARAVELPSGNPDLTIQWDNTVKWSSAFRTKAADRDISSNPNTDDGDRNFGKGLVSNRLDLFSEFDLTYQRAYGMRVSGAGWYDAVYNRSNDNPGFAGGAFPNQSGPANEFTPQTKSLQGRRGELLDAFVFGKTTLGDMGASWRLGKFGQMWGESLFFGANAIAAAQGPVDVNKLMTVPNTLFKEAVLGVPQVGAQLQLNPAVSVGAYYQLRFRPNRLPAVGSYMSNLDVAVDGAQRILGPGGSTIEREGDVLPKNSGQGGLKLGWRTDAADFGFYAVRFSNKAPQIVPRVVAGPPSSYYLTYHEGITAYGISATKTLGDYNLAAEVSTRRNADLASTGGAVIVGLPGRGYAVGNTAHVNLSVFATPPATFLWREATLLAEAAWNRVLSVTHEAQFVDPNSTRDAVAFRVLLEPMYRQVFPGADISVPVNIGWAPRGSRSAAVGPMAMPTNGGGDLTLGMNVTYQDEWRLGLTYTLFLGNAGSVLTDDLHLSYKQSYRDRNFVSLSLRRTF